MTNYDRVKQLKKEEMAHIFEKLAYNQVSESEWLEWMNMSCDESEWQVDLS
jgi:hypothetical protein